ncbi:MAG TPA: hypothetical protein VFK11_00760 [Candidatus Saccharimonadales bacterium]|nr:hypothetical protein [Candidatus Saccharimonadales bacterium]
MATKAKKAPGLARLNVFANSPTFVKLFGPILLILMILAAGYGGYTLVSQQLSSATNKAYIWGYNSGGIKHNAGKVVKDFQGKSAWYASPLQTGHVWYGPYVHLPTGKQYMACFFYAFETRSGNDNKGYTYKPVSGSAIIDIVSNANNSKPTQVWRSDTINSSSIPHKAGTYDRTCLPFYVPKGNDNEVEFRVNHQLGGGMLIKRVRLSVIPPQDNELPNLQWLRTIPNNSGILHDKGWKF